MSEPNSAGTLPRIHGWLLGGTLLAALLWRVLPPPPLWAWLGLPPLLLYPNLRRSAGSVRLALGLLLLFWLLHGSPGGETRSPATRPAGGYADNAAGALWLRPLAQGNESLLELRREEGGEELRRPWVCEAWACEDDRWRPLPGRLEVWPRAGRCPPLDEADSWLLIPRPGQPPALWEPFRAPLAPHAPDRGAQAWSRGRCGRLVLDTTRVALRRPSASPASAPPGWSARLRAWCARRLLEGSGSGGPWLVAVLLGETAWLPAFDVRVWQATGLAHLLAVSGLNVGVLALTLRQGLGPLPLPGWLRDGLLAGLLALYVPLAGGQVSVERAVGMALLLLLSRRLGRPLSGLSVLALAAVTALWLDPGELVRPGFQMSYGAVAGLLLGMGAARVAAPGGLWRRWARGLWLALRVTLAAQAGTLLTQLSCFGALPLSGVLLNLVAVPLSSALTVAGFLHLWLPLPGEPLGALCEVLSQLIVQLARRVPVLSLQWEPHPAQLLLLALALLALLAPGLRRRWSWPAAGGLVLGAAHLLPALARPLAGVCLLDVGQGDALLLRSPAGRTVLVDAGWSNPLRADSRGEELARALKRLQQDPLDWLVLSHPDQDHLGGAAGLLRGHQVRRVLWNGEWKANAPQDELRARLAELELPLVEARPGQLLLAEPGWRLGVLGPAPAGDGLEGNERSIVLRLECPAETLLFTGDMGREEERRLAGWGAWWRAGTLKLGHHGSHGSSSDAFLDQVRPRQAWISSGRGNRYGHPHADLLERLAGRGIRCWRTDRQGWLWHPLDARQSPSPPRAFPRPCLRAQPPVGTPPLAPSS